MPPRPKGSTGPVKTNATALKKRCFSSNAPNSLAKRPKTQGGFVLSSDESDDSTDDGDDDCVIVSSKPINQQAVIPTKTPTMIRKALPAEPTKGPSPTKKVNKARLNALFGRNGKSKQTTRNVLPSSPAIQPLQRSVDPVTNHQLEEASRVSQERVVHFEHREQVGSGQTLGKSLLGIKQTHAPRKPVGNVPSTVMPLKLEQGLKTKNTISSGSETASRVVPCRSLSPVAINVAPDIATDARSENLVLSQLSGISKDAQPYFEYSVFRKDWSSEQDENEALTKEILMHRFTNGLEANRQAEKLFESVTNPNYMIEECSTKRDEHGCIVLTRSIAPSDHPTHIHHTKIYVQRNTVSRFANQTSQSLSGTTFISSTVYILRLFKLIETSDAVNSDSSDSGSDSPKAATSEPVRAYHPHDLPEVYTTLEAANRAARNLQVQLSHEKNPKDAMTKTFQAQDTRKLNAKVRELESAGHGENRCWKSKFNASGLGGDSLELVVEKVGICGPRNI